MTVLRFPEKEQKSKRRPILIRDIEQIKFVTKDDREIFIKDKKEIQDLMLYLIRCGYQLQEKI